MIRDERRTLAGRRYQPKELSAKHHEILRMALLGMTNVQIAEALNCTPATVSIVRNSGLGRQQSSILRAEADYSALETAKRIRDIAPNAIELINNIISSEDMPAAVRLNAAKDVLDRAGFAAEKRLAVKSTSISLSGEDLESLKSIALDRARANGLIIDTPSLEVSTPC